jgi:hypothetical protein
LGALLGAGIDATIQKVGPDAVLVKARDRIGQKFGNRQDVSLVFRQTPEGWTPTELLLDHRVADESVSAGEMNEVFSDSWAYEPAAENVPDEDPGTE